MRPLAVGLAAAAAAAAVVDVSCPTQDLPTEFARLRNTRGPHQVRISGTCVLNQTWVIDAADGGSAPSPVVIEGPGAIVGGAPLDGSAFTPVTDPAILAQLPAAARGSVLQLNLAANGIVLSPAQATWPCLSYVGADAAIREDTLLPSAAELVWWDGNALSNAVPLTPARYPNDAGLSAASWTPITAKTNASDNLYFASDSAFSARMLAWANQLQTDPTSIQLRMFTQPLGWASQITPLQAYVLPSPSNNNTGSVRSALCPIYSSGEQVPLVGGRFQAYNVLAELDTPGEYYLNRTSGMLYVYPPPPAAAAASGVARGDGAVAEAALPVGTVAYLSLVGDLIQLVNTTYVMFDGVDFGIARGAALNVINSTYILVSDAAITAVGNMGVNVTGGNNVVLTDVAVYNTGNGGVFMTSGDRTTLTPSNNAIINSTIHTYNRYQICYVPGVAFAGVGNSVTGTEISDGPHQAIFFNGNNHVIEKNYIHDVCQITSDSGEPAAPSDAVHTAAPPWSPRVRPCSSVTVPVLPACHLQVLSMLAGRG